MPRPSTWHGTPYPRGNAGAPFPISTRSGACPTSSAWIFQTRSRSRAPVKNAAPPAPDAQQGPAEGQRRRKAPWIVAGVAALCAVALALCLLFGHKPAPAGGQDGFDAQAYQQETPNESDKTYLTIDHRTWEESGDGSAYQLYDFTLTENNGVGFTVTRLDLQLEGKSGAIRSMRYGDDDLRASKIDPDIPPYGRLTIDGGFPKGEFTRMGVTVYGTDANGTPLTFRHLITF